MKKIHLLTVLTMAVLSVGLARSASAQSVMQYVRGHILLQVEEHGEAWYIDPSDDQRYYLKDGPTAYVIMQQLSLGITDTDLMKIPVGTDARVYERPEFGSNDDDNDGLPNSLEWGLGTSVTDPDSNNNGFNDGIEVANGYDPLRSNIGLDTKNKLAIDTKLVNRLKGRLLLQVEKYGQVWYVNPVDGMRYYLADGPAAYSAMRNLGLGISNEHFSRITGSEIKRFDNGEVEFNYDHLKIVTNPAALEVADRLNHFGMPENSFVVAGTLASDYQPNTNFIGAYFAVWSTDAVAINDCKQAAYSDGQITFSDNEQINYYIQAYKGALGGADAGTSVSYTIYRIPVENRCYQLVVSQSSSELANYNASLGVTQYNHDAVARELRWPLYTFIYKLNN